MRTRIAIFLFGLILEAPARAADPLQITTYLNDYQMYSVGDALQLRLTATGGTPPYHWSMDPTTAPPGITIADNTGRSASAGFQAGSC